MSYILKYSKNAVRDLSKLDNLVKRKIKEAIETKLIVDPIGSSVKLRNFEIDGARRFRIGNYRVIIFVSGRAVEILRIGHRREIYKS
jgi:mRNA interferase RelE/StbE